MAAASLRPAVTIRAKLAAALTPPLLMVSVLALVMLPMALIACLASAAMQAWTQPPARRSAFRKRYRSSLLMAVGEFVLLGSLAVGTRLLFSGSWWTLAVPGLMLVGVSWFRPKPAEQLSRARPPLPAPALRSRPNPFRHAWRSSCRPRRLPMLRPAIPARFLA